MSNPLDRWAASIREGKAAEAAISLTFGMFLGMSCTDNTKDNVKNTDLLGSSTIDVKILKSPYPAAVTPSGLQQCQHLTLDAINIEKAPDDVMILMVVDYTGDGVQTKGLYYITAGRVKELVKTNPKLAYSRSSRTTKDKVRKIGISHKECGRIAFPGMTMAESVDVVIQAQKHPLNELLAPPDIE